MALKVFKLRKVVKLLCESSELSNRQIAQNADVSSHSVNLIAKQLPNLTYSWSELRQLSDRDFIAVFRKPKDIQETDNYPSWMLWHNEMQRDKDVTARLLWEEWREQNPQG